MSDMHTGMNDFKNSYQPRTNILKDEQGDLVADPPQYYGEVKETFLSATECTWG
jgi:hypothetical protein